MESVGIVLIIAFVYYRVFWVIRNDRAASIEDQTGILRMAIPQEKTAPDSRKAGGGRHW